MLFQEFTEIGNTISGSSEGIDIYSQSYFHMNALFS
jgi:hypothetical protein